MGYERYGLQADIEHIRDEMARLNYRFTLRELGGATAKIDRIRRLIPWFEQERLFLPAHDAFRDGEGRIRDFTRELVEEEYGAFPVCAHDDMLDCLSRAVDPGVRVPFPDAADGRGAAERELERLRLAGIGHGRPGLKYVYGGPDNAAGQGAGGW